MAADTSQKRISAMNIKCPWRRSGVIPDGTIDQGDRQGAFRMYSGILAGAAVLIVQAGTGIIKLIYLGVLEEGHSESR
jgi:hypothetical protein